MSIRNYEHPTIYGLASSSEEQPDTTEEEPPSAELIEALLSKIEQLWGSYDQARHSSVPAIRPEDRKAVDPSILDDIKEELYQTYQELQDKHGTNELAIIELEFFRNQFFNITKYSPNNRNTAPGQNEYPEV